MLNKITHNLTILAAKKILHTNNAENLSTAKRLVSIIAGAYIFQRGIKCLYKHPIIGIQEAFLGGFLMYDAVKSIKDTYPMKPTDPAEIRRNQIQGNDPNSPVPAFV
ncbi:hypothetical protein HDF26_001430 [Pedobacter cryoconitis]|uniref:Uncharacterized protein n=1 Tax=Pedobacter cryoconitis TaxID=188932 RepID=A0A7W8ZQD6_9SPHI|nr:hypothetical protein [Pedobacter cryoconitis]MBB5638060.1 hypothetical protein [Pedobacter cryoconitis]MBB6271003.1 hypothetical protein [Pedobacter cryoconitis]